MVNVTKVRRSLAYHITNPFIRFLVRTGIRPNTLTLINLALSLVAAYVIAIGQFFYGGLLILLSGLFDLLDGALARFSGKTTKFGAILDSVVDRFSEAAVLCGLIVWYILQGVPLEIWLILGVIISSFLVSYIRARAEGLGLQCQVGLFTRAERVIVLSIGLLSNQVFIALCILVLFTTITVAQRLAYLWKQERK